MRVKINSVSKVRTHTILWLPSAICLCPPVLLALFCASAHLSGSDWRFSTVVGVTAECSPGTGLTGGAKQAGAHIGTLAQLVAHNVVGTR